MLKAFVASARRSSTSARSLSRAEARACRAATPALVASATSTMVAALSISRLRDTNLRVR